MKQKINVMVKMRDGVHLSTDIRMPDGKGPFPAVLVRTPYNNNMFITPTNEYLLRLYLNDGYAYVVQDTRGKYDSEGEFVPYDEAEDGYDTVEWIAKQPWCNGKVGMTGASYCGYTQLAAAKLAPPSLCAITPSVMGCDIFKDSVYINGVFSLKSLSWALGNTGRTDKPQPLLNWMDIYSSVPLEKMDERAGFYTPFFKEWLKHQRYGKFWKKFSIEAYYDNFNTNVYLMGGWYDAFSKGTVVNYCGLRKYMKNKKVKLLMGPWTHSLSANRVVGQLDFGGDSLMGIEEEKKRWLDRFVKGVKNGIENEPPVKIFVMGINKWKTANDWPLENTKYVSYYLGSNLGANSLNGDGFLSEKLSKTKDYDEYIYNPKDPVPTIGGAILLYDRPAGPFDQAPIEMRGDVLVFSTDVLKKPVEVIGFINVELYVSSSAIDTDFVAKLCDVYPDGKSINLCDGIFRMRFWRGFDREVMIKPGKIYKITVDMGVTANVFMPGHRIRLEVTSSNFPKYFRNPNTGGNIARETKFKIAKQVIYHSKKYPSRLILPVV